MWSKVKAACFNSATMAWSYVLAIAGSVLQFIDQVGDSLGDPSLKEQLSVVITDAKTLGRVLLGISIVNMIARARSLVKNKAP